MTVINADIDHLNFDREKLIAELIEENEFLTDLVDTIPAKMYLEQDIQEKITTDKHLAMDKVAKDLKRKFSNHPELSSKGKHKRARLDPFFQKSVSQIQQELVQKKRKKNKKPKGIVPSVSLTRAANVEELQKRLQERINVLQLQRKACHSDPLQKKRLLHKVKKLKVRQHKKEKTLNKSVTEQVNTISNNGAKDTTELNSKPLYNKEGKVIFSKLDFSENGIDNTKGGKKGPAGKDYKNLLKKTEKKQEKIQNLKDTNPKKAELVIQKEKWGKAIQKSEGIKIKDDPNLLKKSLKRKEKRKKKSEKIWKEKIEQTEGKKKARQEKRARNIQSRKQEKLEHKIKRAKKKGRIVPGF